MLQLLVELWFWCCLFSQNNFKRATVNSTNRWHTAAYLFLALLFSGNSSLIARKLKILISTCRILVLVVVFSFQILLEKVLKKWQLLVESWLWLLFFLFKFYLKKRWKMRISNFLVESGFWLLFFCFSNSTCNSVEKNPRFWPNLDSGCCFFFSNSTWKSVEH